MVATKYALRFLRRAYSTVSYIISLVSFRISISVSFSWYIMQMMLHMKARLIKLLDLFKKPVTILKVAFVSLSGP